MSCLTKFRERISELQAEAEELETLRENGRTTTKLRRKLIQKDVRCND